ncbi:AraC family transcriptional regulator [Spongiibacter tropicus]|uniref:AraC family transcriptional regulator n=1 Tax=Spongiibacter tropicus TaxID=454602 RepID=UPI0003B59CA7|nr:AraC family transcriptional regulator [Spongiibacter tropicus]MAY40434.1 AraC family transcriptional regulator [Spongiibacter sp.]|tara:strand:- start:669 stop:1679 length:1011 start_codon:yes stop_codon:yes gene_type:complete
MKPKYHSAKTVLAPLQRLRSEGITVAQALAGTGLSLSILERPEQHVSLSQELIFLRNLRQVCGDPGIGLYVGSCYPLSLFGLYGYALMSASTMREALKLAYHFVELSFAFYEHDMRVEHGEVVMLMDADDYHRDDVPMLSEREMVATFMILRGLLGDDFVPSRVEFKHPRQVAESRYVEVFGRLPVFSSSRHAISLPMDILDVPMLQCDSDTAALCIERGERIKARLSEENSIVDEVREMLLLRPGYFPGIEVVAEKLNMSGRTLRRRLREHGIGYQKIVDDLRFALAREYLQGTNMRIEQIASLLGYSDPAHFCHAFRRWSGCAPSQFRDGLSLA